MIYSAVVKACSRRRGNDGRQRFNNHRSRRTPGLAAESICGSPFAAGAPTGGDSPFVLDMACSIIARGKLKFAAQRGEAITEGLALDRQGRPTTDGAAAFEGVVLPMGGVKGAGFSLLMEVLSGVFTGAAFGGEVRNPFTGLDGPQGTKNQQKRNHL